MRLSVHALRWLTIGAIAWILLAQTAGCWWPGELASHWSLHATLAAIPGAIVFRRWLRRLAIVSLPLGAWPWIIAACEPRAPLLDASTPRLRVAQANVCYINGQVLDIARAFAAQTQPPDLLSLIEVPPRLQADIQAMATWPHQAWDFIEPQAGTALLSRLPIARWMRCDVAGGPIIQAWIAVGTREWRVIVAHPLSLVRPSRTRRRDQQLAAIAVLARGGSQPVLVIGDLNCSVASPVWRAFRAESGLLSGSGIEPATWPDWLGPLGIGIDHILVGPGLALGAERVRQLVGSDHRGLEAEVAAGR